MLDENVNLNDLHKIVHQRLIKKAEAMVRKYNRKRKPIVYKIGDMVRISAEPQKGEGKHYVYLGEIVDIKQNFTYRIKWIKQGPMKEDLEETESKRCIPHRLLKPHFGKEKTANSSEMLGGIFDTPSKDVNNVEDDVNESDEEIDEQEMSEHELIKRRRKIIVEEIVDENDSEDELSEE
jgi:hypothetical protein